MKNKKGFTLIELLAVIVILAIIALIVTPVVSNIVANARIAANARSVEGHIRNIELAIITKAFGENSTGDLDSFDTITSGATIESSLSRPGNDNVTCETYVISHGTVITAGGCTDSEEKWSKTYRYSVSGGAVASDFNGTLVALTSTDTHLGIVYMDPTNLKVACDEDSTIDETSVTGCKKFYIYKDDGTNYLMIMDRNLGSNIAYNSANKNTAPSAAFTQALTTRTAGWIGSPDLISADDIAELVGAASDDTIKWHSSKSWANSASSANIDTQVNSFYLDGARNSTPAPTTYSSSNGWHKQYCNTQGCSNYAWLFDYTEDCTGYGCNITLSSTRGYWTKNKLASSYSEVWYVWYDSQLNQAGANQTWYGIRPVLTVDKSLIG